MPLFLEQNTDNQSKLAVWQVTESAEELLHLLPAGVREQGLRKPLPNETLFKQRLASRILLSRLLQNDQLELGVAGAKRTVLLNPQVQMSISHAGIFAAAIVGHEAKCGIDIEEINPRIKNIAPRFMHEQEWHYLQDKEDYRTLMLIWSVKESVFKYGQREDVEFKSEIVCAPFGLTEEGEILVSFTPHGFQEQLRVIYKFMDNYVLTRVAGKI